MTAAAPETVALLGVAVDEAAVRRLCGSAFFQADAFQRAGHVLGPALGPHGLTGRVRGTWRRIDPVSVQVRGGKLLPECGRDGAGFCRHAGALLLHWLREPSAVAAVAVVDPDDDAPDGFATLLDAAVSPLDAPVETPEAELARRLDLDTVPHLREIARRRGLRPSGTKKVDLIRQLAPALADPAGIDAALGTLSTVERAALDALHLAGAETVAGSDAIEAAFALLGHQGKPPVAAAFESGLAAIARQAYYGSPEPGYAVPTAVAARLPALEGLVAARPRPAPADPDDGAAPLGVVEVLQTLAAESLAGGLGTLAVPPPTIVDAYLPPGFVVAPEEAERLANATPRQIPVSPDGFRLAPLPILETAIRDRLAATTGRSGPAVEFLFRLLLTLEVAEPEPRLAVVPDRWRAFLDRSPGERLARLIEAWLLTADLPNAEDTAGTGIGLRARWHPTYANWSQPHQPAILSAARLTARLVGRMAPGRWHGIGALAEAIERLAPTAAPALAALRAVPATAQSVSWWGVTERGNEVRLALRPEEGWSRFVRRVVGALVAGPLAWLGLVDVAGGAGGGAAFRVRPAAGVLVGRGWVPDRPAAAAAPGHLVVGDDLTVLVPAGTTDAAIHGLLARAGELVGAARDGLRYRLTAAGLQAVFEAGGTGPGFAADLAERAGGSLPAVVVASLDRWWDGYGAVRLYDELTLIEFGDDVLLKELLASTALAASLVHAFSPRLVAIPSERVEAVVADLSARGYAPRVVDG